MHAWARNVNESANNSRNQAGSSYRISPLNRFNKDPHYGWKEEGLWCSFLRVTLTVAPRSFRFETEVINPVRIEKNSDRVDYAGCFLLPVCAPSFSVSTKEANTLCYKKQKERHV